MPNATNFKAIISEWRLVIDALESHKEKLDAEVNLIEDEDKQNEIYDDLQRLEGLIEDFKTQFSENFE